MQDSSSAKRAVIIFKQERLTYSETFITNQVDALLKYEPSYVGLKIGNTNQLGNAKVIVPLDGKSKLYRPIFKYTGYILPSWFEKIQHIDAKLIHAHYGHGGLFGLPLARKLGIPLIVTFHGEDITFTDGGVEPGPGWWTHQFYIRRRRLLFERAKLCIAVSNFIRSKLIEKGCPENKILVHYIGVDTNKFRLDPLTG